MSHIPDDLSNLSADDKRRLLARLLKEKGARSGALSYGQRGLWLLHRLDPTGSSYNVPWAWSIASDVDVDALRRAFQALVDRHDILRTTYAEVDGRPEARVAPAAAVDFEQVIAADWTPDRVAAAVSDEAHRPFDLERGPVLRVRLFTRSAREHVLLVTFHHIAYDLWSMMTLLHELGVAYAGRAASLPAARPYDHFVRWQSAMLAGAEGERLGAYWQRIFQSEFPALKLPTDRARSATPTSHGATHAVEVPPRLASELRALAQATGQTLFTILLSAFEVLLFRYTSVTDVVVGSPMTGRTRPDLQDVVGYCLNVMPLRGDLSGDPTFAEVLRRMRGVVLGALEHQDYPFALLVERLRSKRDASHGTLFNVLFALNKQHRREELALPSTSGDGRLDLGGLVLEPCEVSQEAVVDDLVLLVSEGDAGLTARWQYNTGVFDAPAIRRMAAHFERLLESIVAAPDTRISELDMLSTRERQQVVHGWNATAREYPTAPIGELFEARAAAQPDDVAVVAGDRSLTYDALSRRANRLAHFLIEAGVGPDALVGVFVERSLDMVVALLAILKAGGAYLPLDPSYPKDRLAFMADDARPRLVLTERRLRDAFPGTRTRLVCLDDDAGLFAGGSEENPPSRATADNLAYVTYTSGSTGRPKGVEVRHRGVTRLVFGVDYVRLDARQRLLQLAPVAFDASTLELWGALLHGGRLALFTERAPTPQALARVLEREGTTVLWLTASLFNSIVDADPRVLAPVRQLLIGGEALSVPHVRRAQAALPGTQIINGYGPTESTTFTCCYPIPPIGDGEPASIPIGPPIANTRVYVLDGQMRPVAAGVPGELYIAGDGLARGYLRRPDLTADRFVPDPFSAVPGGRLYRTGDLARWRDDGTIAFVGRIDGQVKIRGFRIEPGEIETVLRQHPQVRDAFVDVRDLPVAGRSLVAYVVAAGSEVDLLREWLRDRLPEYMLPAAWVALGAMPLTAHGKVDRAALPAPESGRPTDADYVAPAGGLENEIAAIWRDVLQLERIGTRDSFFDVGGHSLLLMQVHARLTTQLQREIPIVDLFKYPTIEALARHLAPAPVGAEAEPEPRRGAASADRDGRDAIAVVGMAGRFPGAADIAAFWSNLRDGVESIRFFSEDELRRAGVSETLLRDPKYVRARAIVEGADLFDAAFFGYSPRDAALIDPQQRLFLECASDALERAGYDPDRYRGAIGVYAGSTASGYVLNVLAQPDFSPATALQALIGAGPDFLTTRVSYKLNLRGPSVTVQTACSTSLVAVHHACRSLIERECDMALAGGVSVGAPLVAGHLHQEGGILSPDGHCRAFDADARGTVTGHGVGVVVLKRLSDAIADGDTIHAVIRGTAINNDGSDKIGYTAPSVHGQAEVIARALGVAGVEPDSIGYLEAHGTGTALGDPIEISALTQVFGGRAPVASCAIGSLKTNLGHLDAAAGVAGLIKAILAVEHAELPPSLHFRTPNPKIDFDSTPFVVNTSLRPWNGRQDLPRRAGVSSFGIGGTNAHAVIEQAPPRPHVDETASPQLLVLSAKTPAALERAVGQLGDYLATHPDAPLADVAYTMQIGRRQFAHRRAVVCRDVDDAVRALSSPSAAIGGVADADNRSCVLLFSGQGSQYVGMARGIYEAEPSFRADVDRCCEALAPHLGFDLRTLLLGERSVEADARLTATAAAQPALFVVEYAVARLWMRWGVRPAALIGHSVGEIVAACLAGVFALDDALSLVAARGRLMQALPLGAMLAVPLGEHELRSLLTDGVSLAAANAPTLSVVSGAFDAIAALEQTLTARGLTARRLETSHAFHSDMMSPAADAFRGEVARITLSAPRIPMISNVTGSWLTASDATSPDYWARHLREPVAFSRGVSELLGDPARVFVEVGPGRTLATLVRQHGAAAQGRTIATSVPHPDDARPATIVVLEALGRLWTAGVPIDWSAVHEGRPRRRIPLPTYPFERQRYWIDAPRSVQPAVTLERADLDHWFYVPRWRPYDQPPPAAIGSRWVVFADRDGFGERIADFLRRRSVDTVVVRAGAGFRREADGTFAVDPASAADYRALVSALVERGTPPDVVAHFWSATASTVDELTAADEPQRLGYESLLALARAIGAVGVRGAMRVAVVTSGVQVVREGDRVLPSRATIVGACRAIPAEYAQLTVRAIDVDGAEWSEADDTRIGQLVDALAADADTPIVAHRDGRFWAPALESAPLVAVDPETPTRLRERGVYLITGGLGGVGLTLAEYLARTVHARLILVGRSGLPERASWTSYVAAHGETDPAARRVRAVQAIEAAGGEVTLVTADVSDAAAMRDAIARIRETYGRLDGVVHAAGVGGGAVIQTRTAERAEPMLRPKIAGTRALARALEGIDLDFFVLCSSMTAFYGGGGQADYCAANAYLDAFAAYDRARTGRFTVAIDWDTWQQVGMAVDAVMPADMGRRRDERVQFGITPGEGAEAFARVLARATSPQVALSTVPLEAVIEKWRRERLEAVPPAPTVAAPQQGGYARPDIAVAFAAPATDIERAIADVWQPLLGIDRIGREDNFFDLGGHSLLLVQAHATLAERIGRAIPITDLFQFPTIRSLAEHLRGGEPDAPATVGTSRRSSDGSNAIAIIGMSGRFPSAPDLETFWANLRAGVEAIRPVPDESLRHDGVPDALIANPRYVKVASMIDDVDLFDASFFGYSPREAELIDPQHRLFLECAWEALEQAGYDARRYPGQIGVYAGASWSAYVSHVFANSEIIESAGALAAGIGNRADHLPTRVSYKLNLRGPSLNVQTACSTSLVAVHQACRSLVDGDCDIALAGGASIALTNRAGYLYVEEGIASPDGHCRAFDADARGTVWGDGVGVVALKRLADAIADGDTIRAVIRGTAINNDGAVKVGYTAPSVEGQAAAVRRALDTAAVDPATIGYIEAHGTGTTLGDPIEIAALTRAFGPVPSQRIAIGTVKTNIGHLDAAAGVAGLIKTVLSLEHRELPPSLHFSKPNPKIDFDGGPFFVNAALRPWQAGDAPRRAGVSSFGIGGTNAHVIVEEAPPAESSPAAREWQVLPLSAQTPAALDAACGRLARALEHDTPPLADAAYTLQVGRRAFPHRRAIVCRDHESARAALARAREASEQTASAASDDRACVFLFSGQGSQYPGMARGLYDSEPSFRADVDAACDRLRALLGIDLREVMYPASADRDAALQLNETRFAQPALFVVEYAAAQLWMRRGVQPAALLGHSIGELVAACLAGVFSLEDALAIVAARGRLMQAQPHGGMLAVPLGAAELEPLLGADLALAAINGPSFSVASGPLPAIARLETELEQRGVTARRVETSHAFHSPMMHPAAEAFRGVMAGMRLSAPRIPFLSNVTGTWITEEQATSPDYWARHLRAPVQFAAGAETVLRDPAHVFVEVGPGRTLASLLRMQGALARGRTIVTTLRHPSEPGPDERVLLEALAALWTSGVEVHWPALHEGETRRRVPLPTYPFQRQRFWIDAPREQRAVSTSTRFVKNVDRDAWFYTPAWTTQAPPARPAVDEGADLVFVDEAGVGARLVARLRREGRTVIVVRAASAFAAGERGEFDIDPKAPEHYAALVQRLRDSGQRPRRIAHLWSLGPSGSDEARDRGFYSVLWLVQALARHGSLDDPIELTIGGDRLRGVADTDRPDAEKSLVLGVALVAPQEYPSLRCAAVDVDMAADPDTVAAQLHAELLAGPRGDAVAYRAGMRLIQTHARTPVGARADGVLRDGGVYLITGGFGDIGLALAARLARECRARLVLIGRSVPPPRDGWTAWLDAHGPADRTSSQIAAVRALEALGAEVLVARADVGDVDRMRAVVGEVRARFGALHGVIHTAGIVGDAAMALASADRPTCDAQLLPKTVGTTALEAALADADVDFVLLTSSLSAILGGLGFTAYAAANHFLDAFAEARRTERTRWISVNLDGWKFGSHASSAVGQLEMLPDEGVDALVRILREPSLRRIVVSTADLGARFDRYVRRPATGTQAASNGVAAAGHDRPTLAVEYAAPTNDLEQTIATMWQELLGLVRVGIHDDFFELGGHSLLATQLASRLRQELAVEFALADLFEAPTVAGLSEVLMARLLEDEARGVVEQA